VVVAVSPPDVRHAADARRSDQDRYEKGDRHNQHAAHPSSACRFTTKSGGCDRRAIPLLAHERDFKAHIEVQSATTLLAVREFSTSTWEKTTRVIVEQRLRRSQWAELEGTLLAWPTPLEFM
jgi:hypothetical protein